MQRSRKVAALFALCAILLHTVRHAGAATTWTASGNGNWSVDTNWNAGAGPAPTSGDATQVTLSASGGMSYTSTNDIGPFTLNSLTFDNTGTGVIILEGSPLSFAGVNPALLSSGSGSATIHQGAAYAHLRKYFGSEARAVEFMRAFAGVVLRIPSDEAIYRLSRSSSTRALPDPG